MSFHIYRNLTALNELGPIEAEAAFFNCCGSHEWARQMEKARPFRMVNDLLASAERIWESLSPSEQISAFVPPNVKDAGPHADFAEATNLYRSKFGFIFVLSDLGRPIDEIVSICRARLGNSTETELTIAIEEQKSITRIGLYKLLER